MNTRIDTTLLDGLIVGRVDPHIYTFSTGTIPNYLKVGDTYRPVNVRLDEWRVHFKDLVPLYEHIAKVDNGNIFRDYSVHYFLEHDKHLKRLEQGTFELEYYSKEFFEGATTNDVDDAIADICRSARENDGKYKLYSPDFLPVVYKFEREKKPWELRPNQQATVDNFKDAVDNKHRSNLLMYAVMRFGDGFSAYKSNSTATQNIRLYCVRKEIGYIKWSQLDEDYRPLANKWKVLVAKVSPGEDTLPHSIISAPIISEPKSVCTNGLFVVKTLKSQKEAQNLIDYMHTSFFRFMMLLAKNGHNLTNNVYRYVPVVDLSKKWTDADLFKRYNISKQEQEFIKSVIKDIND